MPEKRLPPALRLAGFLTLALLAWSGAAGLFTVWSRYELAEAAAHARSTELRLAQLERRGNELEARVAAALNPEFLKAQNARFQLGLGPTTEPQLVRVEQPVTVRLAAKRQAVLAAPEPLFAIFSPAGAPVRSARP